MVIRWLLALLLLLPICADAQSVPNGGSTAGGTVWTPAQWMNAWESKVDLTNGRLTNPTINGGTLNGGTINGSTITSLNNTALTNPTINGGSITGSTISGGSITGDASTSTAVAASSLTTRTFENRFAETVNVKDFGAKGDCSTDDSSAFNAAFAYIRAHPINVGGNTLYIRLNVPTACYVISSTINATSLRNFNTLWEFHGSTLWGKTNGNPVIDAMNSRFITVRDLTIYGDTTLKPNIGFQHGIIQNNPFTAADDNSFEHIATYGSFTLAAWYNRNSEQSIWLNPQIRNANVSASSYGMIFDGMNHFDVTSQFVPTTYPQDTSTTFLADTIIGADVRQTGGGHAVWLGDIHSHRWIDAYWNTSGGAGFDVSSQGVTAGGSGYSAATVTYAVGCTVTPTATATVSGGAVTAIAVTDPGYGCSSSLAAPTISGDGTGAAASIPALVNDGASSAVLWVGSSSFADDVFDIHTEGANARNVFELGSTSVTTPTLTGFTYRDQNPLNSGSVFSADSPITAITINGLDLPFMGTPRWSAMTMFDTPSMWTVLGRAYLASPPMWNAPGRGDMIIQSSLADSINMGQGNYILQSRSGFGIMIKGNAVHAGSTSTTGTALNISNSGNQQVSLVNGIYNCLRSTQDCSVHMGHSLSNSWVATMGEDGAGGVSLKTGGTTAGGTQALNADSSQNVAVGVPSLSTSATNGFLYVPTMAGAPSGTPASKTGFSPIVVDTTNNKVCFYNGAWKCAAGT